MWDRNGKVGNQANVGNQVGNQTRNPRNGVGMLRIRADLHGKLGKNVSKGVEMRHARSGEG